MSTLNNTTNETKPRQNDVEQVLVIDRLTKKFGIAVFGSGGEVASKTNEFFRNFHASFGGGIRFKPLKKNPTILRLDYGKGSGTNSGIYFGINEAF